MEALPLPLPEMFIYWVFWGSLWFLGSFKRPDVRNSCVVTQTRLKGLQTLLNMW